MPGKKDKLTELPKLEEWKAPWEVDSSGKDIAEDEQEIEPGRLKKYLHGLLGDKLKLQGQVDEATTRAEELEEKVAKAADPKKLEELQAEVVKAQKERDEAAADAEKNKGTDIELLKLRVALSKGLTEVQARRLLGATKEELEQDAEELLASFGGGGKTGDDDEETPVRKGPRRVVTNGGDPDPDAGKGDKKEIDPDEWARGWVSSRRG